MLVKTTQPHTAIVRQYTSPVTGNAIRTRVLRGGRMEKMVRDVKVTNSLTLVSNV